MPANRSMPDAVIIPELAYEDVGKAVTWLCEKFGFKERLRIATHRAQLVFGAGAVIVAQGRSSDAADSRPNHSMLVRVKDVDRHFAHATSAGARILRPPENQPYGERHYVVADLGGHIWTFSQTMADVDPKTWGGTLVNMPLPAR
jgi:uncharacterized glyoxalase superfamily protein PhnB